VEHQHSDLEFSHGVRISGRRRPQAAQRYLAEYVALTQHQKAADFKTLHEGEAFVIPNPWDAGSARVMEALGFKALATTSSGFAFTLGRLDGNVSLDETVAHTRALSEATDLPVSVDLENGYGSRPEDAAAAITQAAAAGAVGGSIEDYDPGGHLYRRGPAVERVAAAVEAARSLDFPFTLTARAENHVRGNPDLDDTISRLQAYERAGADVLFAPGLSNGEEIRAVCDAVSKPVNVLARPGLSVAEIVEAGARRISVGGGLAWVAIGAMVAAAEQIRDPGDLSSLAAPVRIQEWLGG
jgi:2-methylisocitrate lyase-like PEP mutase family enzyme